MSHKDVPAIEDILAGGHQFEPVYPVEEEEEYDIIVRRRGRTAPYRSELLAFGFLTAWCVFTFCWGTCSIVRALWRWASHLWGHA